MNRETYKEKFYILLPADKKILRFKNSQNTFDNLIVGANFDMSTIEEVDISEVIGDNLQTETIIPENLNELRQQKINSTANALKKWCYEHPYIYNNKKYILSEEEYLRLGASYNYYQMSGGSIELYLSPMESPTETVSHEIFTAFMHFISRFLRVNKDAVSEYIASVSNATTSEEIEALTICFITPETLITE